MTPDQGIPGWFVAFFVLAIFVAIGTTLWRVSLARRFAEQAGLDPNTATAVTLLSKDGVDAAYLASSLSPRTPPPSAPVPQPPPVPRTTEQRLQELQSLKDKGLVSQQEYDTRRREILGSI
jgi:hypothetical protein